MAVMNRATKMRNSITNIQKKTFFALFEQLNLQQHTMKNARKVRNNNTTSVKNSPYCQLNNFRKFVEFLFLKNVNKLV